MGEPINPESRELLRQVRELLLEQHKLLLDRERDAYEKANGPIGGPSAWLKLVLEDAHFAWLKDVSSLIVEIDEALSRRSTADQPVADAITERVRELMRPREHGSDFQVRYYNALQASPDVVVLHSRIEKALRPNP
jgi:hypothetical protein